MVVLALVTVMLMTMRSAEPQSRVAAPQQLPAPVRPVAAVPE
jgi:hypothetical protein